MGRAFGSVAHFSKGRKCDAGVRKSRRAVKSVMEAIYLCPRAILTRFLKGKKKKNRKSDGRSDRKDSHARREIVLNSRLVS